MIKAVIFDLDNTLLDFVKMKKEAVMSAISSMKEAGLDLDIDTSYKEIMQIYEVDGWENQVVFDKFLLSIISLNISFYFSFCSSSFCLSLLLCCC